jgi:hypothetical protein
MHMIASNVDPFPAADLETNRSGRLTDAQRQRFQGLAREGRKDEFIGAAFCAALAVLLLAPVGPAPNAWARPLAGTGLMVVALLLFRVGSKGDSLTQDMRSVRVETVEGAIGKHSYDSQAGRTKHTLYYLDVAGQTFEVDSTAYNAAPEAGIVRLYVLPRSHVILNMERMPDRPLPAGALTSPAEAVRAAVTAMRSQDPVQAAEARAEMAALESAMQVERSNVATPPPADQRDPRPLAEAILGTWQTGPISMSFLPDGAMVMTLPGGRQQRGLWSIGPDGRLHMSTEGRDRATDAWVAGGMLTMSENGQGTAYRRASAS